jgi:L-ascorbate metabolism protein UlaG (beta-lactamase superfamily)
LETIRVRWHGHSCFEVATDEIIVATDPHDGKSLGISPPRVRADVVLVSHDHFDHAATRLVEKPGVAQVLSDPSPREMGGLHVRGVPTYHDVNEGQSRGGNIAFVFTLEGVKFCHLGDLGHVLTRDQVEAIGPVDVLFVPVGGVFTIDAPAAWGVIGLLSPKIVVPMHYRVGGLSLSINDISPFLEGADPDCVMKVGNVVEFSETDLEEDEQLVWIFAM